MLSAVFNNKQLKFKNPKGNCLLIQILHIIFNYYTNESMRDTVTDIQLMYQS